MSLYNKSEQDPLSPPCDVFLAIKEFYAIEALTAVVQVENKLEPFRHSHARWSEDFAVFKNLYYKKLAEIIYDYTVTVVAGEMRHGYSQASSYILGYYDDDAKRAFVYEECQFYTAKSILEAGVQVFGSPVKWKSGYGGEKWCAIAKAGLYKGVLPDTLFIDHCVDLTHNGSIYFDKDTPLVVPLRGPELDRYKFFLNFKRYCAPLELLKDSCGKEFDKLLFRAVMLGIVPIPQCVPALSTSIVQNEQVLLAYAPITWGCEDLTQYPFETDVCFEDNHRRSRHWRAA